jgi:hypothetical protein
MLSESLLSMATHFEGHAKHPHGVLLSAETCALVASSLRVAAEAAAGLENLPVPPAARMTPADGVIDLAEARSLRAMRRAGGDWGAA